MIFSRKTALPTLASASLLAASAFSQGSWTPLAHQAPGGVNLMLLLSDGSVMAANNNGSSIGSAWYKLTPDSHGSYVNGTWSTLATAHYSRLYYPSQVLRDGRVFVAGGEYGSGGPRAEIYDPQTNIWTVITPPAALWNTSTDNFYDCNSELTPDGRVLIMAVFPHIPGIPMLYDGSTNTWSNAGQLFRGTWQDEASWVKLADDSILTIDPWGTFSERYIPATDTWVDDGVVPVPMYDPYGFELGAAILLPSGQSFWLGSTGHTVLYTPTGTASPGVWTQGPDIPGNHGTPDAPAAMMVNGKILCSVSPIPTSGDHFPSPTSFYEYDPVANSFASVTGPNGATEPGPCYGTMMLDLPDGNVLFSHFSSQLHVYTPSGTPLAAGKPAIANITPNGDGSYHLTGTGLTGISEGASYGDDFQMNTNYPIVRLTDGPNVRYARTYGWSTTSVMTGALSVTTEFRVPNSVPTGSYALQVIANGIASDAVNFDWNPPFAPSCSGDGALVFCPCFNLGNVGRGCENSAATGGSHLSGSGIPSLAADSVVLTAVGELPTSLSIAIQGAGMISPVPFGDGLRCVNGNLKRLYALNATGGTVSVPPPGALSISAQSNALGDTIQNGQSRHYQVYYRDPNLVFCAFGFNVSNAVTIPWSP
jgi:hypothetical protein